MGIGLRQYDPNVRYVALNRERSQAEKRRLWEWLKRTRPSMAEMIMHDALYRELVESFDATMLVQLEPGECPPVNPEAELP